MRCPHSSMVGCSSVTSMTLRSFMGGPGFEFVRINGRCCGSDIVFVPADSAAARAPTKAVASIQGMSLRRSTFERPRVLAATLRTNPLFRRLGCGKEHALEHVPATRTFQDQYRHP